MTETTRLAKPIEAVLFDLDGTLLDTARDLAHALNTLLQQEDKPALPYDNIRRVVSNGGNAMVTLGFGTHSGTPEHETLYQRLLNIYGGQLADHTCPFPGIEALLRTLGQLQLPWGVVTNKPSAYTLPLMEQIALSPPCSAIVCSDQVEQRKPHPEAMFLACELIGCNPEQTLYVGDHLRDIEAGRNAGMRTIAALYGYIEEGDDPLDWHADHYIQHPDELTQLIHNTL